MLNNILLVSMIALGTVSAQTMLKKGLLLLGGIDFSLGVMNEIIRVLHSPYVTGALVLQGTIAVFWIYILSRMQLVYLITMSGAFFYILLALTSWLVLGERLSPVQWMGVVLISVGVLCFNCRSF